MNLRKAAYAQIENQVRPFVVLEDIGNQFQIRNLGPGTALNIRVSDVEIDIQNQIFVRFPEIITVLPPWEIKQIKATSFHGNIETGDSFTSHLDPKYANLDLQVDVNFCNVEMKKYRISERVRPGNLEILGVIET